MTEFGFHPAFKARCRMFSERLLKDAAELVLRQHDWVCFHAAGFGGISDDAFLVRNSNAVSAQWWDFQI